MDLTGARFVECAVIGTLVGARARISGRGMALSVLPPSGMALKVFGVAGAQHVLADIPGQRKIRRNIQVDQLESPPHAQPDGRHRRGRLARFARARARRHWRAAR
jgi:hypothetical protein